jgi:Ca2+-binding EF-hand superfamily protein
MSDLQEILEDRSKLMALTKEVFDIVDKNGSGVIDKEELKEALTIVARDASMPPPTQSDVDGVLKALDSDGNGTLDLVEFEALIYDVLLALSSQ